MGTVISNIKIMPNLALGPLGFLFEIQFTYWIRPELKIQLHYILNLLFLKHYKNTKMKYMHWAELPENDN